MYLTQGLHRRMQQTPDHVATIFRGRRRTYREFSERVSRLAGALQQLGMNPGDRVSMLALNSDRYLEYAMGVWWGGGVLNPVNTRWSVPEIVYSLDDCDTGILIVDDHFLSMAEPIHATAKRAPILIHAGDGAPPAGMLGFEALLADSPSVPDAMRGGEDLASIMYTGGTTGKPKGVMQSHLNLWSSSISRLAQFPLDEATITLHAAPLFHTAAMAKAVGVFVIGGTHTMVPTFDPAEVLETLERERVNDIMLVPTMLQAILACPDFARRDVSSLKRINYGASPINGAVLDAALAAMPNVEFSHAYGLTEASPVVSVNPPANHGPEGRASGLYRSAGRPGFGVFVKVVDPNGDEVPRNTIGEIVVRGPNIMQGYWNKPEETRQALRNGWLHTGDGAYMDDAGYLFIVDRIKDMIVTGGENVYSAEVENALAQHPAVHSCAVIGVPHERWGEAVHAVVVLRPGLQAGEDELRTHCRALIASYKCPKSVEFRTEMPLSAAGKILKRELRTHYWQDQPRQVS
ncbi:long-chain fatty acid--CoA ligase [Cupriavidus metallidurans]|uniref:acyl-CoA synthetase n=1 Tax=Cupriavidus TaxID=106589 RepID=UPI0002A399C0|nr:MULTISPECIES: long-chain fatty acid--CoA ligase [Cupriavidus]EKZ98462.1 AMP-dependent synthetase/ligase [Cupriavidus sp. HMR-1]GMG92707.1 fatty-acid--CoA ligase [Cupriavidus sp. TKC]HBD37010.1 fatty-acid--CoA ligase [Cupriavidus sp.]